MLPLTLSALARLPPLVMVVRAGMSSLLMLMMVKTGVVALKKTVVTVMTIREVKLLEMVVKEFPLSLLVQMVGKSKLLVPFVAPLAFALLLVVVVAVAAVVVVTVESVVDWRSFLTISVSYLFLFGV